MWKAVAHSRRSIERRSVGEFQERFMSSSTVTQDPVSAVPEQTQHAFAEHVHSKPAPSQPIGSTEAAHLMTFLCQTHSAKQPQILLPPQARDDDAA
ncbi:hypothetical protein XHC_3213 [Xanthomonas hortorum pv. carotae str. M081]|nr:hypothetical protein XHC_3213 [Xanthomonas hortorum pv. carotae str. M081]